jgi:hypothetical protein
VFGEQAETVNVLPFPITAYHTASLVAPHNEKDIRNLAKIPPITKQFWRLPAPLRG